MKYLAQFLLMSLLLLGACGKSHEHASHEVASDSTNQTLYHMVMDVHDEVMPKMEDIYKLKSKLLETIAKSPKMAADKKQELEKIIAGLDSTSNAMMDWMHKFNPLPDSVDQEKAREYLESELEQIKKVRELTNEIIEKAKESAKD